MSSKTAKEREREIKEPRPFGVDYIPHSKRVKPKRGKAVCFGKVSDLPPGKAKALMLDKYKVAVFNIGGKFYAIKDACPHAEYPLSNGVLHGEVVACSSHNWRFNVRTGACLRGDTGICVRTFGVEIRGNEIWVRP